MNLQTLEKRKKMLEELKDATISNYRELIRELNEGEDEINKLIFFLTSELDLEKIKLAESVLGVKGSVHLGKGETISAVKDAIHAISNGGYYSETKNLFTYYFGCKTYDRWVGQRSDCQYGFQPRHGGIMFSIGLKNEIRDRKHLTEEEIDSCLYYLHALLRGKLVK